MVLIAAFLNFLYPSGHFEADPGTINSAPILCSIGLLAAAAGAQVAMSRQLGMPEIPTTQATAAYVDLFVDPNFFAGIRKNRSRNRRILFILTLCIGSFIGAPAYHYSSMALALFLGGCVKIVVTGLFCFNSSQMERRISKIGDGTEDSPTSLKRALDTV
ncbi:hypothetical protein PRZ48_014472 [Zasmidium cellare]|uniref:Uncharacterized protein n=1 Tax=Zasmidium cellare TaxID=395010 RepID=A0ABR0DYK5_ZASCE|nr:hypothetical protein PRZ48_014472 [Zasmidium cellare]